MFVLQLARVGGACGPAPTYAIGLPRANRTAPSVNRRRSAVSLGQVVHASVFPTRLTRFEIETAHPRHDNSNNALTKTAANLWHSDPLICHGSASGAVERPDPAAPDPNATGRSGRTRRARSGLSGPSSSSAGTGCAWPAALQEQLQFLPWVGRARRRDGTEPGP